MKAVILKEHGGVENFEIAQVPIPEIKQDEVLIKTKAISINPADALVRENKSVAWIFGDQRPLILGWDVSGEIVAVGSEVQQYKIGDEVFGVLHHPGIGRTYAEYVAAPAADIALKPRNISHQEAAAATLAVLTVLQPMRKVGIKKGDRVLVTAAGGGVGHFAVQLAKYYGAYVIALASTAKKDFVMSLGADEFIDYQHQAFYRELHDIDLVIHAVRTEGHLLRSLEVIKKGGTLISLWSHITAEEQQRATEKGIHAFYNAIVPSGDDMKEVAGLLEKGILKPYVSKVYTLEDIAAAHLDIEKGHTQGKIIINI
ncbi:NADPH:quinone reductase [Chitinophaga sp. YR627]|uniref:NADP-dependent oxidoreductase n=1 Tax=Chitinophaga sp. YR627 TaxID=1881041 RepID=UPI0008E1EDCD|nr:NADP-dependent oxidoreductase [Chitinophaga sp. YR627]SFO46319.1 NADPH:quinone reductase [Chitinophaga sp. YR627]